MASAMPDLWLPCQSQHYHLLAATTLDCLVTEAHGCEQRAQSCYLVVDWPGVKCMTQLITNPMF